MRGNRKRICGVFALASFVSLFVMANEKPEGFALRMPLQTQSDAGLQRVSLPARALGALRSEGLNDVRVFNAKGEAVPFAFAPLRSDREVSVPESKTIYPINATPEAQKDLSGLRLRIEERQGTRIVSVDSEAKSAGVGAPNHMVKQIGALVDARSIVGRLDYLIVDADLPSSEPVLLTVSASSDLKSWRTLADASPVFKFAGDSAPSNMRISLAGASIEKEYLRITWSGQGVTALKGVQLAQMPAVAPPTRVELPLETKSVNNELTITVPFSTPLHALAIRAGNANSLVPIRVYGRSRAAEPWRLLGSTVVYRIQGGASESFNPPMDLRGVSIHELRFEAERNPSALTSAALTVAAVVNPVEIVFLTAGASPYTLAVGRPHTAAAALPLNSVIPGYVDGSERALPRAVVNEAAAIATPVAAPSGLEKVSEKLGAPSGKSLALWGILLLGVALLGGIAWSMSRQLKKSPTETSTHV